jgi:ketosteroid isomerase-like protein
MSATKQDYIARAEAYFRDVDRFETDAILSHLTDDVVMEVPTDDVRKVGMEAVRQTYDTRAKMVRESWHGDFVFTADPAEHRLAVRLAVKRTNVDGSKVEMDNLTLLTFTGDKISSVCVWMSGENSLT